MSEPLIGPQVRFPTPWRCAEVNADGQHVIVCAEGHYTAEVADGDLAELIVNLVNASSERAA